MMFSQAYVANGARVIIASRKEKQLKEVCIVSTFQGILSES